MKELKYKIVDFNEITLAVNVEFEDGSRVFIHLMQPYPNTLSQLEEAIAMFAPSVYELEMKDAPTNFNYIHEIIGKEMTTRRMDRKPHETPEPDPEVMADIVIKPVQV